MSNFTPPQTSLEQMESRLSKLELNLGGASLTPSQQSSTNADVNSRIAKLMRLETDRRPPNNAAKKVDAKRLALHEEFRTIDRLLSELAMSPIAGPTNAAGSGNVAPMVFRRMEVLASGESMKRDMDLLGRIRDLTLIGTKATASGGAGGATDGSKVINCPVISSERYSLPSDPEAAERLERLCFRVATLNQRTAMASHRADEMLNSYGKIMMALSEKMVLAEEQITG
eukprot:CAMPEP_0196134670 /NCGR_PEP_ID=MMETSP0910-20130528/3519_1 /TAXON_ID=49265 /ORGANISM="Thalassiosira rotula, Strain GSO102" /LENGTH=227 /DNA_ID=CAMNT_0041394653 /DNA_START=149 /DNA_END=832 /DNA_ORIENTATION=+